MFGWFLNPWMLLGGLAIASPILIHLLNKRRFKIVEWAAMDFLFQADKKNRRRVQLENFILLMLRCLAMLLVALLLARPFVPSSITSILQQTEKFERVILIDDSLSQRVLNGTEPALQTTKEGVKKLMSRLANSDESEDWITLMLTSRPDQPIQSNMPLTANTLVSLTQEIDELECSDQVADYAASLGELKRYVSSKRENIGRVVYLFTDLREQDWINAEGADSKSAPNQIFNDVSESVQGCYAIDVGSQHDNNLAIIDIRPEQLVVADKAVRFTVHVKNFGTQAVNDLRVMLQVNDLQPDYETISTLAPGSVEQVTFLHLFPAREAKFDFSDEETVDPGFHNYRVRAEIDRQSLGDSGLVNDQLLEDSENIYAARVSDGIRVLLVDGDPSASSERSETFWLNHLLRMTGSGMDIKTTTVSGLETVSLSHYQVIFLCNVDEASPDRIRSLEQWVKDGGGLVFMPGNRVRAQTFNETFYANGNGLSPLALDRIAGDPTLSRWVSFEMDPQIHPAFRTVVNTDASGLGITEIFSWWRSSLIEEQIGKKLIVPLRLSDESRSPAMVERALEKGKVVTFTIPADGDWTNWPRDDAIFMPVMHEMVEYLVGSDTDQSEINIGSNISYPVDLSVHQNRVGLRNPANEKVEIVAKPVGDSAESESSVLYKADFDHIDRLGFYNLELKRHTGETDRVLFASNVDTRESQLKRLPEKILQSDFFGDKVTLVSTEQLDKQTVSGSNSEIWMWMLMSLFVVLVVEQALGWWWGRNR